MSALNPVFLVPLGLAILVAALAVARDVRARRKARRRVVESPNSHYTSQLVRQSETRNRWHTIDLDRVHEINRGEVVRLLAKAEATSVEALRPNERAFLDHMADLAGTPAAPERREPAPPITPDLRHRPA